MTTAERTLEKDRDNLITSKVAGGWNVTNLRTMKMYEVLREKGSFTCTCPAYCRNPKEDCKHILFVKEENSINLNKIDTAILRELKKNNKKLSEIQTITIIMDTDSGQEIITGLSF